VSAYRGQTAPIETRGMRACGGHCAIHGDCGCPDATDRHGDGAPAVAEAIRRITTAYRPAKEATRAD
jgi:hypothetical protein